MIIDIFLLFLTLLLLALIIKMGERFLWILPLINFVIDIFSGYFEKGSILAIIRAFLLYSFLIFYWGKYIKIKKIFVPIILFAAYTFILIIFSDNFFNSLRIYLQVTISLLLLPLSYFLIKDINDFKLLNISLVFVLFLFIITTIISTIFKIGPSIYTESQSFLTGNIFGGSLNIISLGLIIVPFIITTIRGKISKIIVIIIASLSLIALFLTMKRTSILATIIGLLLYFILTEKKSKILLSVLSIILLLTILYPIYENILIERFEARRDKIYLESVEEEARYKETFFIWEDIFSFNKPMESIFGKQLYNSPGNYASGIFGVRQIHIDYNIILHGAGICGLLIYLIIFIPLWRELNSTNKIVINYINYDKLKAIFIIFFLLTFFFSLSGQMYVITYRSTVFIYLGAILGYFRKASLMNLKKHVSRQNK